MHLGCLDERTGVAIVITAGACHDAPLFETVFEQLPAEHALEHGVMDKGYESDAIRAKLEEAPINPVIPMRSHRKEQREYDKDMYKSRNTVERFINRLKQFRRIATRYEKLAITYLALLHIVAAYIVVH
jgi:transposase